MATEADIRSWIAGYRRDFNGKCQALMWQLASRFGTVVSTPTSAHEAYVMEKNAGRINQGTPPPGAFVYFDIGTDDHIGFMVNGGRIFMGTTKVDEQWSSWNTGPQGLNDYCAITGAKYLGWSTKNGGNTVPFTPDSGTAGGDGTPITGRKNKMGALLLAGKQPGGTDDVFVVAGLSGEPWVEVEITSASTSQLGSQYGSALQCSDQTMVNFKNRFTNPDQVAVTNVDDFPSGGGGAGAPVDYPRIASEVDAKLAPRFNALQTVVDWTKTKLTAVFK